MAAALPCSRSAVSLVGKRSSGLHRGRLQAARALRDEVSMHVGSLRAEGLKFGVVVGRFNDLVTDRLLDGCLSAFDRHGCNVRQDVEVAWVPGSFELPVVAKCMAKTGKYDAIVCIGAVVRGATTHYDEVCSAATSGIQGVGASTGVPTIFGVITTETMEQAQDRAGGKVGNKGFEAGVTAIGMANLMRDLRGKKLAVEPFN